MLSDMPAPYKQSEGDSQFSQHNWPEKVPVTGVRKCLDSVRFCWLMEYIPEGLHGFFPEPKPKWVLLLACVQGIMQTLCLRLSCWGTSPQLLKHRDRMGY